MKREEQCGNCGGTAHVTRGDFRMDEMGIPVLLQKIELIKCNHCGTVEPIIPNMDGLMHGLALAVVTKPCKLNGAEIRFLRTYIGKSGTEFAKLLHVDKTNLSKYENGHLEPGAQTDRLIRFLAVSLSPELEGKLRKLVRMLPNIETCRSGFNDGIRINPATQQYQYA